MSVLIHKVALEIKYIFNHPDSFFKHITLRYTPSNCRGLLIPIPYI